MNSKNNNAAYNFVEKTCYSTCSLYNIFKVKERCSTSLRCRYHPYVRTNDQ